MRVLLPVLSALVLASCDAPAPSPDRGVGFQSYGDYQRQREAELQAAQRARAAALPRQPVVVTPGTPYYATPAYAGTAPAAPPQGDAQSVAADAMAAIRPGAAPAPASAAPVGAPLSAMTPAPAPMETASAPAQVPATAPNNLGISDEQNFAAVSSRETIESDKARIAANRAQYQEVAPTPVPARPADIGPSIVEFALATTNLPGQAIYRRSAVALSSHERACAAFASPDLAQEAFLKRGGPERDPKNLDPDGDGFACSWDPRPFRNARGG
ncbi:hypothetical protein [Ostreiculturibacter nitratireducens]|uniref:hypothetical protein n=1 Tax=Ostreiculturibacter nitratireducens TaxID=3075226 RepID=UPI0031B5B5B9